MHKMKLAAAIKLLLQGIIIYTVFCGTLSAYIIDGSTVTLTTSDRTSDNTTLIQGFLNNSTYTKIIIQPGTNNEPWLIRPLFFIHNNTEIHLNAGTVVEALSGGYPNGSDCMLKAVSLSNIKVSGDSGSEMRMHKEEYATLSAAEWRMVLSFLSCSNVTVSGVILSNAGGDGIYLGDASGSGYCSNVIIADVVVDGAARNGLSIISVDGLTVSGCTFENTQGMGNCASGGPWAGIDLEPNNFSERLQNIEISDCLFLDNSGAGILLASSQLAGSSDVLDITVSACTMQGNYNGIRVNNVPASLSVNSSITFQECSVSDSQYAGIQVNKKARDGGKLIFNDCSLNNNNLDDGNAAFYICPLSGDITGNIELNNVTIQLQESGEVDYFLDIDGSDCQIDNVSGHIYAFGGLMSVTNATNVDITTAPDAEPLSPGSQAFLHHWKLDENSGNTALDSVGGCNGTLVNSPTWTTGRIGGSINLDGGDQLITVSNDSSLNIGTGDFTISLWMQRSDSAVTNNRLIFKGASSSTDTGYVIAGSNTSLNMAISNGLNRIAVPCPIPDLDQWHHYAFTVDRTDGVVKSYLDGIYQASTDISDFNSDNISNSYLFLIGAISDTGNLAWPGKVDDVRIYGRALSVGEIAYCAASASSHWKLDEGSGGNVTDSFGCSNGILQNDPDWVSGQLGEALEFDGFDQFVRINNNSNDLNIGTGDFSIALWMQRSDSVVTNSRLIFKGASSSTDTGYVLAGSNNSLSMAISNGDTRTSVSCPIPRLDQWHHYVFTVNRIGGIAKSYLDGVYQTSTDISSFNGDDISNSYDFLMGSISYSGSLVWPGKIDEIRIYKRVLSLDETTALYSLNPWP